MSNIEEDIKEYKVNLTKEQSIELLKNALNKFEIRGEGLYLLKIAIKNIVAERKQDKNRLQELEEENETFKNFTSAIFNDNIEKEFIPVQKVKDKIEELKKEYEIALEENSTKAFILKCKISALEELLEEK